MIRCRSFPEPSGTCISRSLTKVSLCGSFARRSVLTPALEPGESVIRMCEARFDEKVLRPSMCPFCKGRHVDPAVAKIVSVKIAWRCRECDRTWNIADTRVSSTRVP